MAVATAKALLERLQEAAVLEAGQLQEAQALLARLADPKEFAKELVRRQWLTAFQARALLQGSELTLGSYLLLDRLGEGGSGQVYKARQRPANRLVALKTLRAELLADTETVQRFYREIQVTSKVAHANVVRAYDAGPIGNTHVLAMEYVAGVDLERRVKDLGPLPVAEALDYLRQAALGLQHIHECGLIHRDIKPSNLMLVTGAAPEDRGRTQLGPQAAHQVKILDLGLARLHRTADSQVSGSLSANGSVMMGTPDYMAPEQAVDFHRADIRADIYSLGCVAYFLLTGQPPFGGGSLAQKLMKHHQAEPPAIQSLRPDVPRPLTSVLAKMLAKQPEKRYQEPGQVAAAFTQLLGRTESGAHRSKKRLLAAGAACVAVSAVGLLAILMTSGTGSPATRPEVAQTLPPTFNATAAPTAAVPRTSSIVTTRPNPNTTTAARIIQGLGFVQDVLIDGQEPDRRLGSEPRNNQLKKNKDGSAFLVRFDMDKAGYPKSVQVEKAALSFFVWDPHDKVKTKVGVFAVRTPWVEGQATWKQPADGKQWQGGDHFVVGVDTGPALAHVIVEPDKGGDTADPPLGYHFDIIPLVQAWIDGSAPNYGVAIVPVPDRTVDEGSQSRMQVTATEYKIRQTPRLAVTVRY